MGGTSNPATLLNLRYAKLMWQGLYEESKIIPAEELVPYGFPAEDMHQTVRVYNGLIKDIAAKYGLTVPQSGTGMRVLYAMRSCTLMRKAGGRQAVPSIILMSFEPTDENFRQFKEHTDRENHRITPSKFQVMQEDVSFARRTSNEMKEQMQTLIERVNTQDTVIRELMEKVQILEDRYILGGK